MITELFSFINERSGELLDKVLQHLLLTGVSTAAAILIGVPVGIWLTRQQRFKHVVMAVISILQTIPSLAMLAFLLPFFGIGALPALLALTLYALLPIVRNTITALEGVPADIIEATNALGFTSRQRLLKVELPLGLPVIVAGIRTAAVIGVGIATLAAFIGAGGLGDFIIRGLAVSNTRLILLGAVPAALLALLLDFVIHRIEQRMITRNTPVTRARPHKWAWKWLPAGAAVVLLVMLFGVNNRQPADTIRIGSKNFTEQFILGELMAQMLEAHTELQVERKFNLGSITICHQAMLNDELDIYPEYTGTGYRVILNRQQTLSPEQTYTLVKQDYRDQFNIEWLEPFGFDDTYAIAVRQSFADQHGISSISELSPLADDLTIGFASEFYERADGYPGFIQAYGFDFGNTAEMDLSLLYQAALNGDVDVVSGNSTDGRIPAFNLTVLHDDKGFFPPYYAAPLIRQEILNKYPEVAEVLSRLAGLIDEQQMQLLNYAVDQEGQSAYAVADSFLRNKNLK